MVPDAVRPVRRPAVLAAAIVLGLIASGLLVWQRTEATLSGSTGNPGNSWATGNVGLSDNDSGSATFNVTGMQPGDTGTRCITVSYTGSVTSAIQLYAAGVSGSTALANDLSLVISTSPVASAASDPTCANSYTWTQAWTGSLKTFDTFTGYSNPVPLSTSWTPGGTDHRAFKIVYTFTPTTPVQGTTTTSTFTWEARNT